MNDVFKENPSFWDTLKDILATDERFVSTDGSILRNIVYQEAMRMDAKLITLLIDNDITRKRFFVDISGTLVFDKVAFSWAVNNRQFLPDSYTRFKNRIGLADKSGNMIATSNDVELVFPFKDCVLEGGQTKEDEGRREIFYNETLAPDDVDRLLYPKVFSNFFKYDNSGEITDDFELSEKDNLLIKGNNLLALASLRRTFENKIKLIYIDPPYNTGSDTFSYNDSFKRSTWLTFMRNRLILAKQLLAPDGAIYVQLDYHQAHYAKVLLDEIFGEENFQREIIWRIGWLSGYKTADNNWVRNHDTILFYSKDPKRLRFIKNYIPRDEFKEIAQTSAERYPIEDVWNASEYDDLNSIAIVSYSGETVSKMLNPDDAVKGQKSEKLIERIIKAHTDKGDLVLDFFGGTGTTGAVALKTGRRFILCEQIDSHVDITRRRLQKVIDGDSSGISRRNGWEGGGSFVYCELAKLNQKIVEEIESASDDATLFDIYTRMIKSGFISYKINPTAIAEAADDYAALCLVDKKRFLMELLDKNLLYVNYCDIDDQEFAISKKDKNFTRSFYREEENVSI